MNAKTRKVFGTPIACPHCDYATNEGIQRHIAEFHPKPQHTPTCKKAMGKQTQFDLDCQRCNKDSYESITALRPKAERYFAEQKNTPTPWQYDNDNGRIYDNQAGELVAMTECLDDAAFIVRAVNAHDELLEAAKVACDAIRKNGDLTDAMVRAHNALDKAIAKVGGRL